MYKETIFIHRNNNENTSSRMLNEYVLCIQTFKNLVKLFLLELYKLLNFVYKHFKNVVNL